MSPAVIVNMVQASDLLLLLLSGMLGKQTVAALHGLGSDGPLMLATIAGSVIVIICLARCGAYTLRSLRSLGNQFELLPMPLLVGTGGVIVCLFLMGEDGLPFREWSLLWLVVSAVLLIVFRQFLSRMLHDWMDSGRLARRVAVVGAGGFSREFIERLRSEPHSYTIVGLYDDRLSRVAALQNGVEVRGTVRDLLERSRQEQIDLIVVALPLSAVDRISVILEQLGSAVADVCLTTDFAGLRYHGSQISTVGSNPVVLIRERPLKDWRAAKKMAFDFILGSLLLLVLSPFLVLIALTIQLESPGPALFR